jgi:lysophospholipase L1-like esterase
MLDAIREITERLQTAPRTRVVAFGSSNTERRIEGLHWFDWLELGIKQTYGRVHTFINTGLGGDTSRGLLQRFETDVALYAPHVVFVTIGGNDAAPESGIDEPDYRRNLITLVDQIRALEATPVLQTYYAADIANLGAQHGARFLRYMAVVREIAATAGVPLIDHHRRWEPVRVRYPTLYRSLMRDALHVNPLGNMVIGLDLIRAFGASLDPDQSAFCTRGIWYQTVMDQLAAENDL